MKKRIALFLALLLILLLAACGGPAANSNTPAPPAASPVVSAEPTPAPDVPAPPADTPAADAARPDAQPETPAPTAEPADDLPFPDEDGTYSSRDDVALYITTFGHLPDNFITKKEAQALGWEGGSLEPYAPGKCIGGDRFGNYEGLLPKAEGRTYKECDIDTLGAKSRGAKRIVFSNDGLIYYTADHYESFTLLYGGE